MPKKDLGVLALAPGAARRRQRQNRHDGSYGGEEGAGHARAGCEVGAFHTGESTAAPAKLRRVAKRPGASGRGRRPPQPVRVPLVEGTPGSSGSIETASRSALANALKQASIMWWALEP